jgi:hypothetical protein
MVHVFVLILMYHTPLLFSCLVSQNHAHKKGQEASATPRLLRKHMIMAVTEVLNAPETSLQTLTSYPSGIGMLLCCSSSPWWSKLMAGSLETALLSKLLKTSTPHEPLKKGFGRNTRINFFSPSLENPVACCFWSTEGQWTQEEVEC